MKSRQLIKVASRWFEDWFKYIKGSIEYGQISINGEYSFPGVLRVGESNAHYVIELTGAQDIGNTQEYHIRVPSGTEKIANATSFLNPGPRTNGATSALMVITSRDNIFSHLVFATRFDREKFEQHINVPIVGPRIQADADFDADVPLMIAGTADKLLFRDIDLIRSDGPQIFFRRISTIIVLKKTISERQLVDWLNGKSQFMLGMPERPDILGLNLDYSVSKEGFAVQLLSLANQDVTERIIDSFIQHNKSFFAQALGYIKAFSQPECKIINSDGLEGEFLIPDFMMLRQDGGCDILDLKKALIPSVTVGTRNRLRFNAYVAELVGQLEGYRRYFSSPENARWVTENLGITVADNPRLVGVVGNHNNFERDRVDLAIGPYRDNLSIISYSEVANLLRKK